MSVLRNIEHKLEGLFEGVFGRAFRTHVQPVELARKLVKEMDDGKRVSLSRIYVPNEYIVYLSPDDRAQFEGYEDELRSELREYLLEHARRESYVMPSAPRIVMETDEDLAVGEFGIATRVTGGEGAPRETPDEPAVEVEPGQTMIYKPRPAPQETQAVTPE